MRILFLLLVSLSFLSCSSTKIERASGAAGDAVRSIALLPVESPAGMARERVEYIRNRIRSEMEGSGFLVLEDGLVNSLCSGPTCPEKSALFTKYGVEAAASFSLESINRTNFLAGYYNSISGKLSLSSQAGTPIVSVDHSERERGGLLFNSGQIIQGIISTSENASDESFNRLADKFVRALVSKVPKPEVGSKNSDDGSATRPKLALNSIRIERRSVAGHEICANGTAGMRADLLVDRIRSSLRETSPGRYCGIYLLDGLVRPGSKVAVQLRSPYGAVLDQQLDSMPLVSCDIQGLVQSTVGPRGAELRIACESAGDSAAQEACRTQLSNCQKAQFIVYRARKDVNAFEKVASVSDVKWIDSHSTQGDQSSYAVLAVSPNGTRSIPVVSIVSSK